MVKKPSQPGMEEPEAQYRQDDAELAGAEMERNAEAINASCDEAEAQIERGEWRALDEGMARSEAQAKRRQTLKA